MIVTTLNMLIAGLLTGGIIGFTLYSTLLTILITSSLSLDVFDGSPILAALWLSLHLSEGVLTT